MTSYKTSATVENKGQIRLAGVPFAPGSEVEITISEKVGADANRPPANTEQARVSMKDLFARVWARNTQSVGPLRCEELYDRKVLR